MGSFRRYDKRKNNESKKINILSPKNAFAFSHRRRPRRPDLRREKSVGMGVTSSIRPILTFARARARSAVCAPGPMLVDRQRLEQPFARRKVNFRHGLLLLSFPPSHDS